MGWRFRKSFSPIPGVRLTLSPNGVTTSVGAGPFRITHGKRGTAATFNAFGTGLSYRQQLNPAPPQDNRQNFLVDPENSTYPHIQDVQPTSSMIGIESAGSGTLTTPGLTEFQRILQQARTESQKIKLDLEHSRSFEKSLRIKAINWQNGWVKKHIFKKKFAEILAGHEEAKDRTAELEEQEALTRVQTEIDLPDKVKHAFSRMSDEFAAVTQSHKIWDTTSERSTNKVIERTSASRVITREVVRFKLSSCELIDSSWRVPHLENANGGDLYLYPGFVLYFVSKDAFALLEIKDLDMSFYNTSFQEEESIPGDSAQISKTWAKVNKDGSPDRRFSNNYEIPVMQYFLLQLKSKTGLREEYMISNAEAAWRFARAWVLFTESIN